MATWPGLHRVVPVSALCRLSKLCRASPQAALAAQAQAHGPISCRASTKSTVTSPCSCRPPPAHSVEVEPPATACAYPTDTRCCSRQPPPARWTPRASSCVPLSLRGLHPRAAEAAPVGLRPRAAAAAAPTVLHSERIL